MLLMVDKNELNQAGSFQSVQIRGLWRKLVHTPQPMRDQHLYSDLYCSWPRVKNVDSLWLPALNLCTPDLDLPSRRGGEVGPTFFLFLHLLTSSTPDALLKNGINLSSSLKNEEKIYELMIMRSDC